MTKHSHGKIDNNVWRRLCDWYQMPLGQSLLEQESKQVSRVLPNLFGYHLLQISSLDSGNLFEHSRIPDKILMTLEPGLQTDETTLYGQADVLPFAAESLDVVVLPHVLDFETNPHEILRETERTLIPEGHVVIIGFNPISTWGMWRLLSKWRGKVPWCGSFITLLRLKDWLALLGFDIVSTDRVFFRLPINHLGAIKKLEFMERFCKRWCQRLGAAYVVVARKRVSTLTPIRPGWQLKRRLVPGGLVEPSTRILHRQSMDKISINQPT